MSELVAIGINHTEASVQLRERVAIADDEHIAALDALHDQAGLQEVMLVSTCNRVEVYGVAADARQSGVEALDVLAALRDVPVPKLREVAFIRQSHEAARHVFRVAASLESIVVGEPQILGQVKASFRRAKDHGRVGPVLDRCLTLAFKAAKHARSETEIARGGASVPSVAVDLAGSIFGDLAQSSVLVIGAGEMAEASAVHLRAAGAPEVVVVNRSEARGIALARLVHGRFEPWSRLADELVRADVVVSSTGSKLPILDRARLRPVVKQRRNRPLFLVDIAVPRDIEADVTRLGQVFLYNVDDLQTIVHDNMRARASEASRASAIVDAEVEGFTSWLRARAVGPLIGKLQARGRQIAQAEVARALGKLPALDERQRSQVHKVVDKMAQAIANKLLHAPTATVRRSVSGQADDLGTLDLAEALACLFELDAPAPSDQARPQPATPAARLEPS